jgi:hypothetical protein
MVVVRSSSTLVSIAGLDDVGARLLEHGKHDAFLIILVSGDVAVDGVRHRLADIAHADRRAVTVGKDYIVERPRFGDLVVGRDGEAGLVGVERTLRDVGGGGDEGGANILHRHPRVGELGGIDLDSDRRRAVAKDRHLCDAGNLRNLLREKQVGIFVDLNERDRIGAQRQQEDG